MKLVLMVTIVLSVIVDARGGSTSTNGVASWYGEAHRGKPMADGKKFNPDKLTAASWDYPLGTRVRVRISDEPRRSVVVTITDRGPAKRLVREGRVIDLTYAAFKQLAPPDVGLVSVTIEPLKD